MLSEFAHYYFQYCQYTLRFVQISKQTTSIAHLGVQRFGKMKFPLVPLEVQTAIVEALSAVVKAIPQLKRRAQTANAIRNQVCGGSFETGFTEANTVEAYVRDLLAGSVKVVPPNTIQQPLISYGLGPRGIGWLYAAPSEVPRQIQEVWLNRG